MPIKASSPVVCNCFNVPVDKIEKLLQESKMDDVELCFNYLQQQTQCASNCGSCKPEVKKMIQNHLQETIGSSGMIG
jgi:NAD(P)H-nitrite reductase large subunit